MRRLLLPLLPLVLLGCGEKEPSDDSGDAVVDADGDGYSAELDCDDSSSAIYPGAAELCNGLDDNCDGAIDEGVGETWHRDVDGDGYGAPDDALEACAAPSGYVDNDDDCDDSDSGAYPGQAEGCDGLDNDCDGDVDERVTERWYADADGDGYGDRSAPVDACARPSGHVNNDDDCDDTLEWVNPDAEELCDGIDNDCSRATSEDGMVSVVVEGGYGDVTAELSGTSEATPFAVSLSPEAQALWFCEGTWYVNIIVESDLEIVGLADDPADVVLSGAGADSVLAMETEGVTLTLRDLSIEDGYATREDSVGSEMGGGVHCRGGALWTEDVNFVGNEADVGGGVGADGCDVRIVGGLFESNEVQWLGGGAYIANGEASVEGAVFDSNDAYDGGGLYGFNANLLEVSDSVFVSNFAEFGAGVILSRSEATIRDTRFEDNTADDFGGGLFLWPGVEVVGEDIDFSGNTPDEINYNYSPYACSAGCNFTCDATSGTCEIE